MSSLAGVATVNFGADSFRDAARSEYGGPWLVVGRSRDPAAAVEAGAAPSRRGRHFLAGRLQARDECILRADAQGRGRSGKKNRPVRRHRDAVTRVATLGAAILAKQQAAIGPNLQDQRVDANDAALRRLDGASVYIDPSAAAAIPPRASTTSPAP